MNNEEIEKLFSKLCEITVKNNKTTSSISFIYEQAFDTKDPVKIFRIKTLIFQECLKVSKELGFDEDFYEEIFIGLSYKNSNDGVSNVSNYFSNSNCKLVQSNFKQYRDKQKRNNLEIDEIINLNNDLKSSIENEDLTQEQKNIIYEICEVVEKIQQQEEAVVNDSEIKKMQECLVGKIIINEVEIQSINSETIKKKVFFIIEQVMKINDFYEKCVKIKTNISNIVNIITPLLTN
ncbi:hypothetical protein QUR76_06785 [Arcobacter cryaerophilus gv. pseudocryaerophilus]|uniref:Uncharacterized protein n=3 Tax=unclassified Arcobacter TaxID=2593671 RepID=A0AA96DHM2_9BACT|nr:hypothetical protein RMQ65_01310 [Arcobacter sp. AZ-2023]WPD04831.1 hypothetical protein QUR76_06785 [Arcobacter sp. DSM 115956]WPD06926.1 hypothetical protein QUR78_06785 [Arcobacter sp. DSM 115955]WNL31191.1 hypothetical protein RMQ67_06785 [Arcobacter sp. AZ-2023]WNP37341.1 hypothetical protein RJG58_06785 [Arcobacter sp. AZ-2023]